jgi:hypothetical protein
MWPLPDFMSGNSLHPTLSYSFSSQGKKPLAIKRFGEYNARVLSKRLIGVETRLSVAMQRNPRYSTLHFQV